MPPRLSAGNAIGKPTVVPSAANGTSPRPEPSRFLNPFSETVVSPAPPVWLQSRNEPSYRCNVAACVCKTQAILRLAGIGERPTLSKQMLKTRVLTYFPTLARAGVGFSRRLNNTDRRTMKKPFAVYAALALLLLQLTAVTMIAIRAPDPGGYLLGGYRAVIAGVLFTALISRATLCAIGLMIFCSILRVRKMSGGTSSVRTALRLSRRNSFLRCSPTA